MYQIETVSYLGPHVRLAPTHSAVFWRNVDGKRTPTQFHNITNASLSRLHMVVRRMAKDGKLVVMPGDCDNDGFFPGWRANV